MLERKLQVYNHENGRQRCLHCSLPTQKDDIWTAWARPAKWQKKCQENNHSLFEIFDKHDSNFIHFKTEIKTKNIKKKDKKFNKTIKMKT